LFAADVRKVLQEMEPAERREVKSYLTGLLSRDPFPHVYRRIRKYDGNTSIVAVKRWRFLFTIEGASVRVYGVAHDKEKGPRT
jgi:mRNA-degrading endonuclease RelE of RelBE toxin-antitoxin system